MPADAAVPLSLDELALRGLTVAGLPAARVVVTLRDGRRLSVDLPVEATADPDLTSMELAVLRVVDTMRQGEVLTNDQIAERAGHANSDGLRTFVRSLYGTGKLEKAHRGWRLVRR